MGSPNNHVHRVLCPTSTHSGGHYTTEAATTDQPTALDLTAANQCKSWRLRSQVKGTSRLQFARRIYDRRPHACRRAHQ